MAFMSAVSPSPTAEPAKPASPAAFTCGWGGEKGSLDTMDAALLGTDRQTEKRKAGSIFPWVSDGAKRKRNGFSQAPQGT